MSSDDKEYNYDDLDEYEDYYTPEEIRKIKRRNSFLVWAGALLLIGLLVVALNFDTVTRLYRAAMLFNPNYMVENFRSMNEIFDSRNICRSSQNSELSYDLKDLPLRYEYRDTPIRINEFIHRTDTTGLIVLKGNTILYEDYLRGNDDSSRVISWSVSKSIVSALFGIAVDEGYIGDINEPVNNYLDLPEDSGYYGVTIKDVLQMSSGVRFNEDYADHNSDVNRMGRALAFNTSLDEFVISLEPEREPGTYNQYVSADTQLLGMIIREATGKTLTEYTEEKLWKPLGMEADAYWSVDGKGVELAFGGMNAVLRDYARFGLLYLNGGTWEGQQIIPAEWVRASVTPDAPHLMPGDNPNSDWVMGYGYQWWIPESSDGEYLALGIYGQAIYVNPKHNIVIAKSSAYSNYNIDGEEMELESVDFFRAIANHFSELEDEVRTESPVGQGFDPAEIYPEQPWDPDAPIWPRY